MKKLILCSVAMMGLAGCGEKEQTVHIVKVVHSVEQSEAQKERLIQSSFEEAADTYINQANQIQASNTLYEAVNGKKALTVDDFVGDYMQNLQQAPIAEEGSVWQINNETGIVFIRHTLKPDGFNKTMCNLINDNSYDVVKCYVDHDDLEFTISHPDKRLLSGKKVVVFQSLY